MGRGSLHCPLVTFEQQRPESAADPRAGRGAHDKPPPDTASADPTQQAGVISAAHGPAGAAELHGVRRPDPGTAAIDHARDDQHANVPPVAHGGHDEAHAEPRLGPIDLPAWGLSLLGLGLGALVCVFFYLAIN